MTAGVGMGLSEDGLERFGAVAAWHVGDDKVPGLVALVAHGDDVHVEALGRLAVGGRPLERASLFRIASTHLLIHGDARSCVEASPPASILNGNPTDGRNLGDISGH